MSDNKGDVYTLVDDQISNDSDFQTSLEDLDDGAKEIAISEKRTKLVSEQFASQGEKLKKAEKNYGDQKTRAEKAEDAAKKSKKTETSKKEKQPKGTDYGQLAWFNSEGLEDSGDRKIVVDEAVRLKIPYQEVLKLEHIQKKLKDAKTQREAEKGMPTGDGSGSKGNKGSVEYWTNKTGKNGQPAPVPAELGVKFANEVIDARVKAQKDDNMFSDVLHN